MHHQAPREKESDPIISLVDQLDRVVELFGNDMLKAAQLFDLCKENISIKSKFVTNARDCQRKLSLLCSRDKEIKLSFENIKKIILTALEQDDNSVPVTRKLNFCLIRVDA